MAEDSLRRHRQRQRRATPAASVIGPLQSLGSHGSLEACAFSSA